MKTTPFAACALAGLAMLASHAASAQQNTVRGGLAYLTIHSSSPNLTSNGPDFLTPQPAGITVDNASTIMLGYTRALDEHWDLDFALGIPPAHDVRGRDMLAPFGVTAKVKQAAPTVFGNYNFGAAKDALRPFVGVGVNFTHFYDGQSTASGDIATGGPTKISLTNSVGLALQAGLNYKLFDGWSIGASVATAKVKSDMTATTGSIERKTTIDFKPVVYTAYVAYSF
ncbi:MAG: OmpW family outer membrane protein [Pseudomonadota bacterium]